MKKITTEAHVKALVKDWFDVHGAWSYAPVQNGLGVHGIPDRIGCLPIMIEPWMVGKKIGAFVGVECKAPGRRTEKNRGMSKHQMLVMGAIYNARGQMIICDCPEELENLGLPWWGLHD